MPSVYTGPTPLDRALEKYFQAHPPQLKDITTYTLRRGVNEVSTVTVTMHIDMVELNQLIHKPDNKE